MVSQLIGDTFPDVLTTSDDGAKRIAPMDSPRRIGPYTLWNDVLKAVGSASSVYLKSAEPQGIRHVLIYISAARRAIVIGYHHSIRRVK